MTPAITRHTSRDSAIRYETVWDLTLDHQTTGVEHDGMELHPLTTHEGPSTMGQKRPLLGPFIWNTINARQRNWFLGR